jgi:NADH-quinone oxidoreductase subunit M|nr:NADH dehydrogenase subunit 4 [Thorea hispida]ARX95977.1 NADH dehydrogenase subunit 4 [Thorea hispida]
MNLLNPLIFTIFTPVFGSFFLLFIPGSNVRLCRNIALISSLFTFLFSLVIWLQFDSLNLNYQFLFSLAWFPSFNLYYTIGVDGLSIFFVILTTFLLIICILASWDTVHYYLKEYLICFLLLEFLLLQVFCVLDLIFFYMFFESLLMPMFLIIGIWGARTRKIRAAYQFFLYTLIGSLLMLLAILVVYFHAGTTDVQVISNLIFPVKTQMILWLAFFIGFAIKIPMIPFHIWLPEAHAEAPTAGSIILAGVLLKIGGYGFLRFSLPMFPVATIFFSPVIFVLSISAILYASLITLCQIDFKKIIAYSSVSHMGFVTLGIFTLNVQGIEGSLFLMLGHALVSSALFLCVGLLYDRHHTRIIKYYNGLVQVMPIFLSFFLFFSFANLGFPATSNFIGEFLILLGSFKVNTFLTILSALGLILSAAYSSWLVNRISFGPLKITYLTTFQDLSRRELLMLVVLCFIVLWLGIYPVLFLDEIHLFVFYLLAQFI